MKREYHARDFQRTAEMTLSFQVSGKVMRDVQGLFQGHTGVGEGVRSCRSHRYRTVMIRITLARNLSIAVIVYLAGWDVQSLSISSPERRLF